MAEDYDYEGYRNKYGKDPYEELKKGHLTDEFKKPNHITFSDESVYHSAETPGGRWSKEGDKWHFHASEYNVEQHGAERMKTYFEKHEPDAVLHLPKKSKFQNFQDEQSKGLGG
jgi:uncharacterized protein YecA (UPF0149 family)